MICVALSLVPAPAPPLCSPHHREEPLQEATLERGVALLRQARERTPALGKDRQDLLSACA